MARVGSREKWGREGQERGWGTSSRRRLRSVRRKLHLPVAHLVQQPPILPPQCRTLYRCATGGWYEHSQKPSSAGASQTLTPLGTRLVPGGSSMSSHRHRVRPLPSGVRAPHVRIPSTFDLPSLLGTQTINPRKGKGKNHLGPGNSKGKCISLLLWRHSLL